MITLGRLGPYFAHLPIFRLNSNISHQLLHQMLIRIPPCSVPHLPIFHKSPNKSPLLQPLKSPLIRLFKTLAKPQQAEAVDAEFVTYDEEDEEQLPFPDGSEREETGDFSSGYRGREEEKDPDKDPELAEILGSCFDDPKKAQSRVEERIRKKRSKILHAKTGAAAPMQVVFNKFGFSNSYIWFEFYNAPLTKDISLICDIIRSWHIVGRLGGCNSMNMQLSQAPLDSKRPNYDPIEGANATPATFYNIGDLEVQDNLARIWVDIGTTEPLLLDVLINALICVSSDYVGIKQLVFGGTELENWKENSTKEDPGCSIHKI